MGRRVPTEQDKQDETEEKEDGAVASPPAVPSPTLRGGALGVPSEMAPPKTTLGGAEVAPTDKVFEPPKRTRYQITRDARVHLPGGVTWLRAGQYIDDANYDIPSLVQQGVPLVAEKIEE